MRTLRLTLIAALALATARAADPATRVAYDDAGNAAAQPHLVSGSAWTFTNAGNATPQVRSVAFGPSVEFAYTGLKPQAKYAAKLRFFSDGYRSMRVRAGASLIADSITVDAGQMVERLASIPAAAYTNGQLRLTIELVSGPNAAVSEVEILSDDPAPLAAVPEPETPLPQLTPRPVSVAGCATSVVDLAGTWKFNPAPPTNFAAAAPGEDWKDIAVPGEWLMQGFTVTPQAAAGYARSVDVPADWAGQRVLLRCDAVFSKAEVWVNGAPAGGHLGGFTPFELDVTDLVKPGAPNQIALAVTSETVADTLASASKYACHALGGITRGLRLLAVPAAHATSLRIATRFDAAYEDATLEIDLACAGDAEAALTMTDPAGRAVPLTPGRITPGHTSIPVAAPRKWDPEHPNLYRLTLDMVQGGKTVETLVQRVGFRQIDVRANELFVNGRLVKLRGSNHHEVHPLGGRTLPPGTHRRDIELFREANVNLLRTCHYPPDEALMEAADELGMFIECEAPLCWAPGDGHRDYVCQATAEMILTYRNHPSVLYWSLANESAWGPHFIASSKLARTLDPTRPQTFNNPGDQQYTEIANLHYPGYGGPARARQQPQHPVYLGEDCHLNAYNRLELATDPALRDLWGRYTRELWDALYDTTGCLGQSIWSGIDDTFYLPNGDTVGYGTWGPIDGWRRPKPEYWGMKKAYSPIRLIDGWTYEASEGLLQVGVENRFLFTDLAETRIEWAVGGQSGTCELRVPPGRKGSVIVPLRRRPKPGEALDLTFRDPRGFAADQFHLELAPPAEPQRAPVASRLAVADAEVTMESGPSAWRIDRKTGLLRAAGALAVSGPTLMILPLNNTGETQMTGPTKVWTPFTAPCAKWTCASVTVTGASVVVEGTYDGAEGSFTYSAPSGRLQVAYAFAITKPVNPRQVGLVFALPRDCETLAWERIGYWDVYPEDHIARLKGSVRASEGFEATSVGPRAKPNHPWRLDNLPYGNNDFCSTKHNVRTAAVTDAAGRGIAIDGGGLQHVRCWRTADAVNVLVADYSNGGSERFLRGLASKDDRPLKPGDTVRGVVRLGPAP